MGKFFFLTLFCFMLNMKIYAQEKPQKLTEVISLVLPAGEGRRASSVAWHPKLKRYYVPRSGNADYLMYIFNSKGVLVSPGDLKTRFDIRGFWYSPALKTLCANGYNYQGWVSYVLNKKGIPVGIEYLAENFAGQPDAQSVASFDEKNNAVYFLKGQNVLAFDVTTQQARPSIRLHINFKNKEEEPGDILRDKAEDTTPVNINNSTVVYTAMKNGEFALLDFKKKEIQLYDRRTGYLRQRLSLPADAPADEMLSFSYCNNIFWLFDITRQTWKGYKRIH